MALRTRRRPRRRCAWVGDDPVMQSYHDEVWGVPVRDDRSLYAKLMLDIFQAGLSWRTILHKEEAFRAAFEGFDPERVACYGARERRRLLADAGIVRNRLKIDAAIHNAERVLALQADGRSLSQLVWGVSGGVTLRDPRGMTPERLPATSPESLALSRALKRDGFRFVGPTVAYAFMQAVGVVDDHVEGCFRYVER